MIIRIEDVVNNAVSKLSTRNIFIQISEVSSETSFIYSSSLYVFRPMCSLGKRRLEKVIEMQVCLGLHVG